MKATHTKAMNLIFFFIPSPKGFSADPKVRPAGAATAALESVNEIYRFDSAGT
jgi:hypothetical protein